VCGIVALVGARPDSAKVHRALDALRRRGPDGRGIYVSPDGRAVLGHTRLAIVDVERGAEPVTSEDGRYVLVFNGEIYGHAELRAELERRGHRFKSRSDAEVALHLYEDLGPSMLHRLRGEFAFAIWDARERSLFAARDRFGVKPLSYAVHDGVLHVASQAKALFAAGVPSRWDHDSFFQAASLQYTLPDATLFDGIRVLPPGHFFVWSADAHADGATLRSVRIERYWDLDYPTEEAIDGSLDMRSAATALRDRLADAVRVRLVADVPVAFQLSGGIDSSTVLALASAELARPASAFTVAFEDPRYDERSIAEEMAAHVGARLHVVSGATRQLLAELPSAVVDGEGLAVNAHIAAKRLLARAVHDAGYKVVLTGEGADEILAGYAHLRCDLGSPPELAAREGRLAKDNVVSTGLMLPHGDALDTSEVERRLGFVPTWLRAKAGLGLRIHGLLRDDWLASVARDPFASLLDRVDETQLHGRGRVEQALYLWSKLALEGYILRTLGDGMEMAASVEGRVPFLDHHVFELVRTFPTSLKIHDGVEKSVLRAAVGPLLTDRLRTRQKHPFLAPPLLATAPDGKDAVPALTGDLLRSQKLAPFLDPAKVSRWLDRLPAMTLEERTAAEPALMIALSATLLHAHYRL
jgi:asparagine synthase (glutamine-hydrolysing)